ncbi:MAG: N-acetyl-gamma-glutamyl-phosphate reductase [Gemmatimonadota bacterium]|nr:N-acetyl-gamma-glutamyl-phosphate reductase [Gemmatimonadota bacterium]
MAVGVLGATGYTGRELLKKLSRHSRVRIAFATSESEAGAPLRRLVRNAPDLALQKAETAPLGEAAVVFSCLPHGDSSRWVERVLAAGTAAIDLSADLRVQGPETPEWAREAVYGLPELHREKIRSARLIANPGCYPTAAILSIAPLARRGLLADAPVIINAASGVTGAGRTPKRELLFAEVAEDFRAYGVGNTHRHLAEMVDQVGKVSTGAVPELIFTPHLLPVRQGILETIHITLRKPLSREEATAIYREDYGNEPFVEVLAEGTPTLTSVVGTNYVSIAAVPVERVSTPMLQVIAAEDNLIKGAIGQAIQNLNIMQGWPETEGLL